MKRLAEFLRSVIPADPAQLLFVIGIVCLVISPRIRWWPAGVPISPEHLTDWLGRQAQAVGVFLLFPIMFASVAGYFACFWPGDHPTRRVLYMVSLPAIGGFSPTLGRFLYLTKPYSSILETSRTAHATNWVSTLWKLPAGFHICLIGLVLILLFTSRLAFRIAKLPLALPERSVPHTEDRESWERIQVLIWVLVGPLFLVSTLLAWLTVGIPTMLTSRVPAYTQSFWFSSADSAIELLIPFGAALWIVGKEQRQALRNLIRLPRYLYFVIALAIPMGVGLAMSTGQYLFDRADWAVHSFGKFAPPQFGAYFDLPNPWFLLLFFSALFEEIIFRGLLQPHFLKRYGLYRGIFLVGIVWAAFHLFSDFSFSGISSDEQVAWKLGFRISMCLVLSFVLGWLTLRSRSVLPAAVAHAVYNVFVYSGFGPHFPGKENVRVILFGILAYVLFHYWPVTAEGEPMRDVPAIVPEPAG